MDHTVSLNGVLPKKIYDLGGRFTGKAPNGEEIGFTNYYMQKDGQPFFGVSGEIHFSRIAPDEWEDTLVKAKMGGINIVATYVFWNVHEEVEGTFRWDGCRDLHRFLQLCQKHGLYVILRIGPFAHGEMRNGGLPDWLFGKPFEVRACSEGFYACVRRLFCAINEQVDGLYYRQGGSVVAAQLDNEYMHSAAPWELTTGTSNEWVPSGSGGDQYMRDIKRIMQEEGIVTPFYTCTSWGGARTPVDEALPLWGGYAYWPWIFYASKGEHPATPEYIYRDYHNNAKPRTYNFEPRYEPESRPYACCEMMGGMSCFYNYRFALPFESVDALANIKLGSGCNLLGYYMYRGGSNPKGERTPYLNENSVPKINYDYQAAIGQYGQLRPSWFRLKTLHYFCVQFGAFLCKTTTVQPDGMEELEPKDTKHLRYSVRVAGNSGFVFIDNFQDHFELPARQNENIVLELPDETLRLAGLSLAGGENVILPFNLEMDGVLLKYAAAQPITRMDGEHGPVWFFFAPDGMTPVYHFDAATVSRAEGCPHSAAGNSELVCTPAAGETSAFTVHSAQGKAATVVTLTRADSMNFYKITLHGKETAFLSTAPLLWDGEALKAELRGRDATVCAYPANNAFAPQKIAGAKVCAAQKSVFSGFTLTLPERMCVEMELAPVQVGPSRYTLTVPTDSLRGHKQTMLCVDYYGDIGHVFLDGKLVNDNFANGVTWETRIDPLTEKLENQPLTLYITPLKENAKVNVDSPMAARTESASGLKAGVERCVIVPVNEVAFDF